MPRTRYIYVTISQSTLSKLPIACNETAGVYYEVASIARCSSMHNISTTAHTYKATAIKSGKAVLKT